MQCGHCGTEVPNGFSVCSGCGAHYRHNFAAFGSGALILAFGLGTLLVGRDIPTSGYWICTGLMVIGVIRLLQVRHKAWYRHNA